MPRETHAVKKMENTFAALSEATNFSKCAHLDCNIKPFCNGI